MNKNMKKYIILSFIIIVILLIILTLVFKSSRSVSVMNSKAQDTKDILEIVQEKRVDLDKFLIYGTHLNISGNLNVTGLDNIKDMNVILVDSLGIEKEYPVDVDIKEENIYFKTSEYINQGINLEEIEIEEYYIFLKVILNDDTIKYYSFNQDNFENIEYYTISNNNKCNLLTFRYHIKNSCIKLDVKNIDVPDEIYDITIDAGHGGNDPGATYNGYNESDITLEYSLKLKEELEKQGLKVKLTRVDDTRVKEYGEDGRAVVPNKVKSKYTFSIHLNSSVYTGYNGVEVYASSNLDLSFAKMLSGNIVRYSNTNYSNNEVNKTIDGVYVRTLTNEDIKDAEISAKKSGYIPYNLTTDTPYLFMIRETGGKSTNAYVDGRNKDYEENIYYNSNIGNESYLLELGYINSDKDLDNLLNNKDGYIKGIVESIIEIIKVN